MLLFDLIVSATRQDQQRSLGGMAYGFTNSAEVARMNGASLPQSMTALHQYSVMKEGKGNTDVSGYFVSKSSVQIWPFSSLPNEWWRFSS